MNTLFLAKRRLVTVVVIVLMAGLVWFLCLNPRGAPSSADGLAPAIPPKAERVKMWWFTRIRLLERHGQVPEDADLSDWQLAQHTSWWGKPIDPDKFWSNRAVWCDSACMSSARRHGRAWPPIPAVYSNLLGSPVLEMLGQTAGEIEGPGIRYAVSSRESAFWDHFIKSHPKPPEDLSAKQFQVSEEILSRRDFERYRSPSPLPPEEIVRREQKAVREAINLGYPAEAFSDAALFWTYVLNKGDDLKNKAQLRGGPTAATHLFDRVSIDHRLIIEPLSESQLKVANAWKAAYLQRLRREKTDESYINAYLKAWNLSREEVFGESPR